MIERGWALQSLQILGIDNIELFLGTIAHFLGINCSRKLLDYVHWIEAQENVPSQDLLLHTCGQYHRWQQSAKVFNKPTVAIHGCGKRCGGFLIKVYIANISGLAALARKIIFKGFQHF